MKIWGVIPARFASTRFPGKPLKMIAGKPLLQWVIEGVKDSRELTTCAVATDEERIAELARSLGVQVFMTSPELPSGTDRIWACLQNEDVDVAINIQGDEPLITGVLVDRLASVFRGPRPPEMATLAHPLTEEELQSPNAVKVVVNQENDAIYFSRFPIPHSRHDAKALGGEFGSLKHLGLYGYTKAALKRFCEAPPALIEKAEALEQLRALSLGLRIRVVRVEEGLQGVDTPEDAVRVETILQQRTRTRGRGQ